MSVDEGGAAEGNESTCGLSESLPQNKRSWKMRWWGWGEELGNWGVIGNRWMEEGRVFGSLEGGFKGSLSDKRNVCQGALLHNTTAQDEYTITSRSTDVMVMTHLVQNVNHSAFRSMFEREKNSGNNFNDWFRQLNNVLLEWNAVYDAYNKVACLILGSMTLELHRQFENSSLNDMTKELKDMFEKQAGVERFDLIQNFHACKKEEGKPVVAYVIQMKGYVDQLERLGYVLPQDLIVGLILNGLTKDFSYEKGLPKKAETPRVMMIKGGKIQKVNKKSLKVKGKGKANDKGNDKQVYIPKPKNPKPSAKENPAKDDAYHYYKQGFREARKLKQGALYLYVGNGVRAQVEAIGSFDLVLPNGLVICLDNCHYAPSILRGVVSVHRLVENGFVQRFIDFGISVSKNNVHYFNVIPSNGIYEIDMHNLVPNVNSIYNVSTKRAKHNLDSTYLWHCRLAHISKKRIEKLQHEGLLKSIDDESFDQCVSCLSGKMIRKSFPYSPKRATDLLGIIHTDVCSPHRHVSKEESATRILNMVPTKKVDKTPYELWYGKVPNLSYLNVWGCEALVKRDTSDKLQQRSVNEIPMEVEGFEPPQEEDIPICRSERTHRAPNRLSLNVEAVGGITIWYWVQGRSSPGRKTVRNKILKRYGMDNSKRCHILMQERLDLNKTQGASTPEEVKRMQNVPYASDVGSIINPEAELRVDCYCNAGFETDRDDTKSQTGYVFILNGCAVDWKSSKQSTTAMSATKAEYIADSEVAMETIWIRKFISGLGKLRFLKVHTDDNLADPFTKALPKEKLTHHARSMGLRLASSFM
ncbi:retrotransposon protein, putative, ty1-copia subclass [Tanacetum coccineum]